MGGEHEQRFLEVEAHKRWGGITAALARMPSAEDGIKDFQRKVKLDATLVVPGYLPPT
jgi:hypothetical protein